MSDFGLTEGEPNTHIGQGTANHRFFFQNFYFELLYLQNVEKVLSPLTAPTKLYDRLTNNSIDVSPFGFCLRPSDKNMNVGEYSTWEYKPLSFPEPFKIDVFEAPVSDPLFEYMSFLTPSSKQIHLKPKHKLGVANLTSVIIHTPFANLDNDLKQDLEKFDIIKFKSKDSHLLELELDNNDQGQSRDFRPDLPLIVNW